VRLLKCVVMNKVLLRLLFIILYFIVDIA